MCKTDKRSHFGSSRCWTSALEPRWSYHFGIKQPFGVRKFANEGIDVRLCGLGGVISGIQSTTASSSQLRQQERTANLEKVVSWPGSLIYTLQDLCNEASAAGIDGKIKLQAAELQELEDVRQKAWIFECAAVADKLARIQEPEPLGEKSVCHVEEDAWQQASSEAVEQGIEEKHRNEAVEQDIEAKPSM